MHCENCVFGTPCAAVRGFRPLSREINKFDVMENEHQRRIAVIMFTDIVGYSALAQKNEDLSLELLEEHRELLRPLFPRFGGREIETIGDAFFLEFGSVLGTPILTLLCAEISIFQ